MLSLPNVRNGERVAMDTTNHAKDIADNHRSRQENTVSVVQKMLCCFCFRTSEKDLEYDQENPQHVVDDESIHIVVEDLGIDNPGFSLCEVEHCRPPQQSNMGRSASSVCQRAAMKKKLAPLSSLPLQSRAHVGNNEEDFLDALTPPVINLIPPTPSDVIDNDQFFDMNSEEDSPLQTSGSEGVDSIGSAVTGEQENKEEKMDQDVEYEGLCDNKQEEHPEISEPQVDTMTKKNKVDKTTIHFLRSTFQVAPLPEYPRKSKKSHSS